MQLPSVLTVAGSDSSGGAGIQADLKTIAALGLYGQSVITALTAQNTCGVRSIQETSAQVVIDQMDAVFEDIRPAAVKIGMLSTSQIARTVAQGLRRHGAGPIVVDPVMVATSGAALMADGVRQGRIDTVLDEHTPEAQGRPARDDPHGGEVYVYRREGQPCLVCGTPVLRKDLANRNLFWCPRCQNSH